jgi:hypothetical protein
MRGRIELPSSALQAGPWPFRHRMILATPPGVEPGCVDSESTASTAPPRGNKRGARDHKKRAPRAAYLVRAA